MGLRCFIACGRKFSFLMLVWYITRPVRGCARSRVVSCELEKYLASARGFRVLLGGKQEEQRFCARVSEPKRPSRLSLCTLEIFLTP